MISVHYVFDRFVIDVENRALNCDGAAVEISSRYLDALILLVSEAGRLVTKDRFLDEVWRGVPVTDEALTQCVKMLRRQLGDDAAKPRFIATVPKHGYRFIGSLGQVAEPGRDILQVKVPVSAMAPSWGRVLALGGAGTLGAGVAGVVGGLFYGSILASQPPGAGVSGASVLLVLLWLTVVAAVVGGAGVSFGIAVAGLLRARGWAIVGGALGGLLIGGSVRLLGLDAFNLLLGRSPGDITGAFEGMVLGGTVGLGWWLSGRLARPASLAGTVPVAAASGGLGAILILSLGGRMMGGSLDALARAFPDSRLDLGRMGRMFGESDYGAVAKMVTGALEGALFGGFIVGAMYLARRRRTNADDV